MKKQILLSILITISLFNQAQNKTLSPIAPNVIPNTPEANKLIGQIAFPVDYNTGLTTIEIPIYEIRLKGITIPIKLSYNSSGFKPQELSEAGTGWTLKAEPYIARQVNGLPDEKYFYSKDFKSDTEFNRYDIAQLGYGIIDGLPDQFFYSLPTRSGSFFTKRDYKNKSVKTFATLPYEPIQIRANDGLTEFELADTDGTKYVFSSQELTDRMTNSVYSSYNSCYKAKSITTSNNEVVTFEYKNPRRVSSTYNYAQSASLEILDIKDPRTTVAGQKVSFICDPFNYRYNCGLTTDVNICPETPMDLYKYHYYLPMYLLRDAQSNSNSYTNIYYVTRGNGFNDNELRQLCGYYSNQQTWSQNSVTLFCSKIKFPGGTVEITMVRPNGSIYEKDLILKEIIVKNESNEIIRWAKCDINYTEWARPRLDGVSFYDKNGIEQEKFSMEYDNTRPIKSADCSTWNVNSWGYFSNDGNYQKLIPSLSAKLKIHIPRTGGQETDTLNFKTGAYRDYYFTNPAQVTQVTMLKKITYPTKGYSIIEYEPAKFYDLDRAKILYTGCLRTKRIDNYTIKGELASRRVFNYGQNGSGLGIPMQILKDEDFMTSSLIENWDTPHGVGWEHLYTIFKMELSAFPILDNYLNTSLSIVYDHVTEYTEDKDGNRLGKTEYLYDYSNIEDTRSRRIKGGDPYEPLLSPYYLKKYQGWNIGQQKEVKVYEKTGINYKLINNTSYTYQTIMPIENIQSYLVYPHNDILYTENCSPINQTQYELATAMYGETYGYPLVNFRQGGDNSFYSGAKILVEKREDSYTSNGKQTILTQYRHNKELMPIEIVTTESDGTKNKITNQYPHELTDDVSAAMKNMNFIAPVIWQKSYKNDNLLYQVFSPYKEENGLLLPHYIETAKANNSMKQEILFEKYDTKGNLQGIREKGAVNTVYLWGYNSLYPVIKIEGLSYSEVSLIIGSSAILEIASCISSTTMLSLSQTIRTKLSGKALVTTYTFKPLTGISSSTDPQGITTYYEYDNANRLKEVYINENNQKKIIQAYSYSY